MTEEQKNKLSNRLSELHLEISESGELYNNMPESEKNEIYKAFKLLIRKVEKI